MSASLPQQWLDKATEDLIVARLVLTERHTDHACFLAQQCIEKALKAYLLDRTGSYSRTHKLVDLLVECESYDAEFAPFLADCITVDQYYIPTRYPDSVAGIALGGMIDPAVAEEAVDAAEVILRFVTDRLPERQ
jgi:HEPN domain-containing protein